MERWSLFVLVMVAGTLVATVQPAPANHGGDLDCGDFSTQADAQNHMEAHPGDPDGLDGSDQDGRACESNPCPCEYGTGSERPPTDGTTSPAQRYKGRVLRVLDGDTIEVRLRSRRRRTVRLIGIDAPETRSPGVAVECGGRRATRYMKRQALRRRRGRTVGEKVRLTTDPTQDRVDGYGRLLAYVKRSRDGRDIGKAMIRAGWATTYVYDGTPFRRFDAYASAQEVAHEGGRGVWSRCDGDFHSKQ